jgi:hypothetical protein
MSEDPKFMSELAVSAISAHEMYIEYVKAGFSAEQSLQLVIAILATVIRGS